jgi:mono/diheme cytochrome c family protein
MQLKRKHFGMAAVLLVIVFLIAGDVTIRRGFSARDKPTSLERMVARTARSMAVPGTAKNMRNPIPYSEEVLREARAHWADHCAFCHANDGSGSTEVGRNLYPKAPDVRKSQTQRMTDGELYYTIENGIRLTGMPAWGNGTENDEDSWKLVYFIRHLPEMTPQEEQLSALAIDENSKTIAPTPRCLWFLVHSWNSSQ